MNVFVFCPLYPLTDPDSPTQVRIFGRSLQSIMRMDWPGRITYHFERCDTPEDDEVNQRVLHQYRRGRRAFLASDADAMLTIECDMVVPRATLLEMAQVEADVVYALYVNRHGKHNWLCAPELGERHVRWLTEEEATDGWGRVIPSQGVGLGCTLIRRHVLEAIDFRRPRGVKGLGVANDWHFALDAERAGYRQVHHLGVACGHITTKPAPMVLWPDPEADQMYSVEMMPGTVVEPIGPGEPVPMDGEGGAIVFNMDEVRRKEAENGRAE